MGSRVLCKRDSRGGAIRFDGHDRRRCSAGRFIPKAFGLVRRYDNGNGDGTHDSDTKKWHASRLGFLEKSMRRNPTIAILVVSTVLASLAQAAEPATPKLGQSPRYCNPLPLVTSSTDGSLRGVSLGDVTVLRDGDKYYMFCSGGAAWV